jgi:hypothetical protein
MHWPRGLALRSKGLIGPKGQDRVNDAAFPGPRAPSSFAVLDINLADLLVSQGLAGTLGLRS